MAMKLEEPILRYLKLWTQVIEEVEQFDEKMIDELDRQSNQRIADAFTWEKIVTDYEKLFKG